MRVLLFLLSTLFLSIGFCQMEDHPVEDAAKFKLQTKANPKLPTLFLVGDSTMKVGSPGQRGWGEEMAKFFDPSQINIVNEAIGGRSSRTFQNEGRWAAVASMISKGDWVILEFGHNDSGPINEAPPVTSSTRARGTIKGNGEETQEVDNILTNQHEVVHSFGWYMRKYATDTKAKGATPNGYGDWAKQAAAATQTTFIDHNEIIAQAQEKLGQEKSDALYADKKLHANLAGADFNARCAIAGLKSLPGKPFGRYFSQAAAAVAPFKQ